MFFLSGRRGSNPRPLAWKANALPTELLPHFLVSERHLLRCSSLICRSLPQDNSLLLRPLALNLLFHKLRFLVCFGRLRRLTSHLRSVIYGSKLLPSSLVCLEFIPKQTSDFCHNVSFGRLRRLNCGRRWIRTTEGINQQIYSLPHLATLVFSRFRYFPDDFAAVRGVFIVLVKDKLQKSKN